MEPVVQAAVDPRQLFATPFEKGVEYSQVSLSLNRNNNSVQCTVHCVLDSSIHDLCILK